MPSDLRSRLQDPGFTPAQRDFDAVFSLLADPDRKLAERAERALARAGLLAAKHAEQCIPSAEPRQRARLVNVISRVLITNHDASLAEAIIRALDDSDAKTRRNAIIALGKLDVEGAEQRLLSMWDAAPIEHRRSIAEALGKVGGPAALEFLSALKSSDPELVRLVTRAKLMLSRTEQRRATSTNATGRPLSRKMICEFRCRRGLAQILAEEVRELGNCEIVDASSVRCAWSGSVSELLTIRTALEFGICVPLAKAASEEERIVLTLLSLPVLEALSSWTQGIPRFRLAWQDGGHRRSLVWRIADAVAKRTSAIVNDPTNASWEILVTNDELLLIPRAYEDPRFAYRKKDVPAASHPTLAAALARTAEPDEGDVVWDPFVGSGLELIERARLGRYRALYGTDLNEAALDAARENLKAAGVTATLSKRDALSYSPPNPTLIISNPPMGRRVARDGSIAPLLLSFLQHAFDVLVEGGRLVWLSPLPGKTAQTAQRIGFNVERLTTVDMGGFDAELQILRKASARPCHSETPTRFSAKPR